MQLARTAAGREAFGGVVNSLLAHDVDRKVFGAGLVLEESVHHKLACFVLHVKKQ